MDFSRFHTKHKGVRGYADHFPRPPTQCPNLMQKRIPLTRGRRQDLPTPLRGACVGGRMGVGGGERKSKRGKEKLVNG